MCLSGKGISKKEVPRYLFRESAPDRSDMECGYRRVMQGIEKAERMSEDKL